MENISVFFTVARAYFHSIDDDEDGNFTLSKLERFYCNRYGNIWGSFHNATLAHDPEYNLFSSIVNTPVEMLTEAAVKLGCTKAMIFPNKIVTHRSFPIDRGECLDFYKCYFYCDNESIKQDISEYFETIRFYPEPES